MALPPCLLQQRDRELKPTLEWPALPFPVRSGLGNEFAHPLYPELTCGAARPFLQAVMDTGSVQETLALYSRYCNKMCPAKQGRPRGCRPQKEWLHPGGAAKLDHLEGLEFSIPAGGKGPRTKFRWVEGARARGVPEPTTWLLARSHCGGRCSLHMVLRKI